VSARVVLASRNQHKVEEVRRILEPLVDVELVPLQDGDDVAETGATFADNAFIKARAAAEATGLPAVADDSGLAVEALNGMPGVLSARWAGRHGDDVANLELLLAQLAGLADDRRVRRSGCRPRKGRAFGRRPGRRHSGTRTPWHQRFRLRPDLRTER
jgi:XTP/dITP diphosphohydrolase